MKSILTVAERAEVFTRACRPSLILLPPFFLAASPLAQCAAAILPSLLFLEHVLSLCMAPTFAVSSVWNVLLPPNSPPPPEYSKRHYLLSMWSADCYIYSYSFLPYNFHLCACLIFLLSTYR